MAGLVSFIRESCRQKLLPANQHSEVQVLSDTNNMKNRTKRVGKRQDLPKPCVVHTLEEGEAFDAPRVSGPDNADYIKAMAGVPGLDEPVLAATG